MTRSRHRNSVWPAMAMLFAVGSIVAQTPDELFDLGTEAYREGHWQEAAEAFGAVLEYGIEDVRVEYNLGNTAFKLGRLGEAILHYERAYRLSPTDPDIRANLDLALSMRRDRVPPTETAAPIRIARDLQDRLGPDRQAVALLALIWAICGVVAWCSARPGGWNGAAGWTLALLLVLALIVGISWWVTYQRLEDRSQAVVLVDSVDILAGPGDNNAPLITVHEGLVVRIRARRENWLQVTLPDGLNGWVPVSAVGEV